MRLEFGRRSFLAAVAVDVGYSKPVLWLGSLGDSTPMSASAELKLAKTVTLKDVFG